MEEELKILKIKYNDLLKSLLKGNEYLKENPEDEKAQKRLDEIAEEIQNIMKAIPNMTNEEMEKGFIIEKEQKTVKKAITKQPEKNTDKKQDVSMQLASKKTDTFSNFNDNWEMAQKLCQSSIIPKEFQGKPENVLLCMGMSQKMGLDLITVMNNLQLVMGRQEWKGSFIPVLIEKTGKYYDLDFVFVGKENTDDWGCYLEATRARDGKRIKGTTITIALAKAEGWYNRNNKWKTMGRQLLIYRASTFFARAYCADALSGINTEGETNDINRRQAPIDILS